MSPRFDDLRRQPLLRLFAVNLAVGIALALVVVAGLLALDAHRLSSLVMADRNPVVALGLLAFGFVITFGAAVVSTAVMRLGTRDRPPSSGGGCAVDVERTDGRRAATIRVTAG